LAAFTGNSNLADLVGHIGYDAQRREIFNFGKHKGETLEQTFAAEPSYYGWMMNADFPLSTKQVVQRVYDRMKQKKAERKQEYERIQKEKLDLLVKKFQGEKD
ncbi:MAG: hypothetical protein SPJ13_03560, partial [Bacteroidales bacterium]|nr:hypothetical protein [Bacteroidales bacterium]